MSKRFNRVLGIGRLMISVNEEVYDSDWRNKLVINIHIWKLFIMHQPSLVYTGIWKARAIYYNA